MFILHVNPELLLCYLFLPFPSIPGLCDSHVWLLMAEHDQRRLTCQLSLNTPLTPQTLLSLVTSFPPWNCSDQSSPLIKLTGDYSDKDSTFSFLPLLCASSCFPLLLVPSFMSKPSLRSHVRKLKHHYYKL